MKFPRASGILLHPTSLPGNFGIGDLGDEAFNFVDFLVNAGQTYWQILPLAPTGMGNSPYSAYSAFAGNPSLISPERLVADGLISRDALAGEEKRGERVDFGYVYGWKPRVQHQAFENFQATANAPLKDQFNLFCRTNSWWLDDYATFRVVKTSHDQKPWYEWAEPLKSRDETTLEKVRSQLAPEISAEKFLQYLF